MGSPTMSATAVRLTLKFNFLQQIRGAGWAESWDLSYTSLATALANQNNIDAFIQDRVMCLGIGPILVEAVLSAYVQPLAPGAPPVRRNTISLVCPPPPTHGDAYNPAFNGTPTSAEGFNADFVTTDLYCRLETSLTDTPVYSRNAWLAGLPDVSDTSNSANIVEGLTLAAVDKFLKDVNGTGTNIAARVGVQIRSIDRSGANPVKPCTAWNLDVNTFTVPLHGFAVNQPIMAEGMTTIRGGTAPRGRYLVKAVINDSTISLQGNKTPTTPIRTGGFRPAIFTFNPVKIALKRGFTKRNHGRPSGLSVGRRPKPATVRS